MVGGGLVNAGNLMCVGLSVILKINNIIKKRKEYIKNTNDSLTRNQ